MGFLRDSGFVQLLLRVIQPVAIKGSKSNFIRHQLELRIKSFFGTSENAVKTQVWIAVSIYVLIVIIKKRLKLEASLYNILQILSTTIFERLPLNQPLTDSDSKAEKYDKANQLILFD